MAPDWFLNGLPCIPLDGELFAGRGQFQTTISVVRKDNPIDSEWRDIQFAVYSSPPFEAIFATGEIKNANFHCAIQWAVISEWLTLHIGKLPFEDDFKQPLGGFTFDQELHLLNDALGTPTNFAYLHPQTKLPNNHLEATYEVEKLLEKVLDVGGEGLIIRSAEATWFPKRMKHILKYKPHNDDEAVVVGFTSGRKGREGTLLGKIGALVTNYDGKRLEIAGLTHAEREFATPTESVHALENPGADMPSTFSGKYFKVGDTIQFKYRELSDCGIPKEARYFRGT